MRGKRLVSTLVVVLTLVLFASAALAAAAYFRAATGTWAGVSGVKHSQKLTWRPSGSDYGINGFIFYERGDDPIKASAWTRKLCNANCPSGETHSLMFREPKGLPEFWSVDVAKDHYVTAIQVCTNDKSDAKTKIKGLRAWGARINVKGKLVPDNQKYEEKLTNCKKWRNKISCSDGRVATGFKVHYDSDKVGFSGMSIACSALKKK